jgi:hypothetical protein
MRVAAGASKKSSGDAACGLRELSRSAFRQRFVAIR